ncbi:hypothetical protein V5735_19505 [Haladaptatus sp. SPP-AMP-3]|uniref:hypothetical protein n=1 Tax=Haladaptatus sp. SPP-AMP-3 TaxID=3121295 RepID=UPI003C2DD30E
MKSKKASGYALMAFFVFYIGMEFMSGTKTWLLIAIGTALLLLSGRELLQEDRPKTV